MTDTISRVSTRRDFLPFNPPLVEEEEIREVVDTLRSPWITTGPKTRRFEEEFTAFVRAPGALALNSCTAAMHVALACLDLEHGDEVITTPMTFTATANVIEHVGARPVLVDVEPDTLNIDPKKVEAAITPRTRALLPVHYTGHPVERDALDELARAHNLTLIEDAAHALPASFRGRPIGSSPNPVAFSFYATKNLTTAEGGMLTAPPEFLERARIMALHGMSRDAWKRYDQGGSWRYEVVAPGFKYNLTDVASAIGLWQLRKQERFHQRRLQIVKAYLEAFGAEEALEPPVQRPYVEHAWHLFVLRIRPQLLRIGRDQFIDELTKRNIGTSVHFIPIHVHPFYRKKYGYIASDYPVAFTNFERMLSLPLHPGLTDQDVGDVIEAVLDVVQTYRR
ncbi:MAG TPA: DegT/DnrJ/EryC1/StrS family aminotransferase [Gemmatimonadales bacterium]|nr:DegT/DnrJ/EryC1/StrS family aminotransferase [Gemmatimonadales bacterium]